MLALIKAQANVLKVKNIMEGSKKVCFYGLENSIPHISATTLSSFLNEKTFLNEEAFLNVETPLIEETFLSEKFFLSESFSA